MHSYLSYMRHNSPRPAVTFGAAFLVLAVIGSGLLDRTQPPLQIVIPVLGLFLFWLAWELYKGISRFWAMGQSFDRSYAAYLGLGFALLGGCALLLRITGGLYSPFYPLMYLTLAFLASIGTSRQGAMWFGYAFLAEFAAILASGPHQPGVVGAGALHLMFLGCFAGSHHVYLHGMLRELSEKRNQKRAVDHATTHLSMQPQSHLSEVRSSLGMTALSLASIDQDRQVLLARLKEGLDAHGCALLWLDAEGAYYEVASIETDAAHFDVGPFPAQAGPPAGLFKGENTLRLSRNGDGSIALPYYGHDLPVRSWLAVPIVQDGETRGILCVDRVHPVPFSGKEELVLEATAAILSRALQSERALHLASRDVEHLNILNDLGLRLSQASTEMALAEQALELASTLAPFDWGFLSRVDAHDQSHTVLATTPEVAYLYGESFELEGSLMGLASKHGCALPEKGILRTSGPLLATEDPPIPELASLFVLPLMHKHEPVGCLVMASQDPQLFAAPGCEKMLAVFAQQAAGHMASTQNMKKLEELTRKDSLTQLANHSTLMEGLAEAFTPPSRSNIAPQPRLSLMMFNIDDFRFINDRYGHTTGDRVLKRIAKVLMDFAEPNDLIARYSGEEFAMLCRGLDVTNALKFADHICRHIAQLELCSSDTDPEIFSVSVSTGLATSPEHAVDADTLLHHAIEAMLYAKQRGGNQAVLYANAEDGVALATPNPDAQNAATPPRGWGWGSLPPLEDPKILVDPERWSWTTWSSNPEKKAPASFLGAVASTPPTPPLSAIMPEERPLPSKLQEEDLDLSPIEIDELDDEEEITAEEELS